MQFSLAAPLILASIPLATSGEFAASDGGLLGGVPTASGSTQEPELKAPVAGLEVVGSAVHDFGSAFRSDVLRHEFQLLVTGEESIRIDTMTHT